MMWLDDQNYTQFTRGWYAKQLKFPYNYIVPTKSFNHSQNFIAHKLNIEESDVINEETEEKVRGREGRKGRDRKGRQEGKGWKGKTGGDGT